MLRINTSSYYIVLPQSLNLLLFHIEQFLEYSVRTAPQGRRAAADAILRPGISHSGRNLQGQSTIVYMYCIMSV